MHQCGLDHPTLKSLMELNKAADCRAITGILQPTSVNNVYCLAAVAPPRIRRNVATRKEKRKQIPDSRHPLHEHTPVPRRLKSCKSFARVTPLEHANSATARMKLRSADLNSAPSSSGPAPSENFQQTSFFWKERLMLPQQSPVCSWSNQNQPL